MKGMNVEFVVPRVVVDEGKGRKPVMGPVLKRNEELPILSMMYVVAVSGGEQLGRHSLHLGREDVLHTTVERLGMVPFAPKPERSCQPGLREQLSVLGDQLGQDLVATLDRNDVSEAYDPNLSVIPAPLDPFDMVNMEEFRVNRTLVEAEMKLFYPLYCLSSFHIVLL